MSPAEDDEDDEDDEEAVAAAKACSSVRAALCSRRRLLLFRPTLARESALLDPRWLLLVLPLLELLLVR